jgi:hypothetical protein
LLSLRRLAALEQRLSVIACGLCTETLQQGHIPVENTLTDQARRRRARYWQAALFGIGITRQQLPSTKNGCQLRQNSLGQHSDCPSSLLSSRTRDERHVARQEIEGPTTFKAKTPDRLAQADPSATSNHDRRGEQALPWSLEHPAVVDIVLSGARCATR